MLTRLAGPDAARLFSSYDLSSREAVVAAVSGGSDSTALLLLLHGYLRRAAPSVRLVAVSVDHALRPDSAGEAEAVARLCRDIGVEHRTCVWTGPKPTAGLLAAAREERYRLLAEAADAVSADIVFTGHTADDQAETVLMRQSRQAGRGLAGMAPATLFDGHVWIARPLLETRRAALRAMLRADGVAWIDDPSNENERFERPRLRNALAAPPGDAALHTLLATASQAAQARTALGRAAASLIRDHARLCAPGLLRIGPGMLLRSDAALYALRLLLAVCGGKSVLPDAARVAALLDRLAAGETLRAVLSRTLVDSRKAGIFLLREARGLPPPGTVRDGAVWDGRYRIGYRADLERAASRPGAPGDVEEAPASLVRAATATLPGGTAGMPVMAPWARFLPSFDLEPASAIAALIGAAEIPRPPCRRHIAPDA